MAVFQIGDATIVETEMGGVTKYAVDDTRIYRIGVEGFPNHVTNVYLILDGEASLVDVGFNSEKARADLEEGFDIINKDFKENVGFEDITDIIITHGHGDHFYMLEYQRLKGKRVYIHPLDSKVLTDYHSVHLDWKEKMAKLTREAGCDLNLDELFANDQLDVQPTDYGLVEVNDGQEIVNGYEVCHTPGHSPGHICLKVGPVLFLGDHMLSLTTPHQVPKTSWQGVGLKTYIDSLIKAGNSGIELGLAAHEDTIYSVKRRAEEIEAFHYQRLGELLELCKAEKNLYQLTSEYYRRHPEFIQAKCIEDLVVGDKTFALEEIKAHVEYLLEHDRMIVTGIDNGVVKYRSK